MTSTNLGMTIPTVGADTDNWGNDLNTDLGLIDAFAGKLMPGPEVTLASAATTDIGNAASTAVAISGTTTITSFGSVANCVRFVRFTGALTLTHNATSLILLGGASRTTAAGDVGIYKSDSSGNWREITFNNQDVSKNGSPQFGALTVNGNGSFSGNLNVAGSGGISAASINCTAGDVQVSGFGFTATMDFNGSILSTSGNGITMRAYSGGVYLANGATSWAAASSRAIKTNIQPITDALATVNKMQAALGNYNSDEVTHQLRPFLFYEDAVEYFPYIATYRPANKVNDIHPETGEVLATNEIGEYKGIMYETAVPLLFAAIQELTMRVEALEAPR
ncbi:MAG TPA: hypothetical protein VHC39_16360 [Rhizomicrobium sp.]|nr:hypothetical protein [Rhizomicrobium sp.]